MDTFRLRSGKWVRIRPIRPDDGPALQVAYSSLSQESKYRRFLAAKPHLTSADTRYLVDVDGHCLVVLRADRAEVRLEATGIEDRRRDALRNRRQAALPVEQ